MTSMLKLSRALSICMQLEAELDRAHGTNNISGRFFFLHRYWKSTLRLRTDRPMEDQNNGL